jgi:hypothetical protein
MPSSGMSDALLMSQILWPGHHPSNYGLDAAKPRARYGVWPRAPSRPAAGGGRSSRGFTTTEPAAKFIRTTWARKRKEVEDPGGVRAAPSRTRCRAWCGLRTGAHEPGSQAARRGGASYAGSSCSAHPPSDWMEKRARAQAMLNQCDTFRSSAIRLDGETGRRIRWYAHPGVAFSRPGGYVSCGDRI